MWHVTRDTWHVTLDTWHLTCDTWWGVNILSTFQLSTSFGLGVMVFLRFWGKGGVNHSISHKAVCRTAPATPGLVNIYFASESPDLLCGPSSSSCWGLSSSVYSKSKQEAHQEVATVAVDWDGCVVNYALSGSIPPQLTSLHCTPLYPAVCTA